MSLSHWKRLAQRKTEAGQAVNELYDDITEEKIRSKTTDAAIAKTFRLDRLDKLDRLDQIAEQTKPRRGRRVLPPRINADGGIDYAPEVDPYEEMDVEGLLDLEDYVPPQAEKQIAKKPQKPPQYEMDPSFWQIPNEPPPGYSEIFDDDDDDEQPEEEMDDNKILDQLDLPNYDDVEKRLAKPEMNYVRRQNYLRKVQKDAETKRKQVAALKTHAANAFKRGEITKEEMDEKYAESDRLQKPINELKVKVKQKLKPIIIKPKKLKAIATKKGRGVVFYNNSQELLQKLAVILGEMEAGNTSTKMRNMGQTILDTLLENKSINKTAYGKLVKKYFPL